MPRDSGRAILGAVVVARCVLQAALFAAVVAAAELMLGAAAPPVPVVAFALALTGSGILLASVLRDVRADRLNIAVAVAGVGGAAIVGVALASPHPTGLELLTRAILFGILGEAFVWRTLSVARGLPRWTDTRNAAFAAIGAIALAALLPGPIDRAGLLLIGLAATAASGVALSLARSAEELALAGREARGGVDRRAASGTAVLVAVVALVGALATPSIADLLARAGRTIAPIVGDLFYGVLLLLGYGAALVVELIRGFLSGRALPTITPPMPPASAASDAETLRQIEASRRYVVGAAELVVAVVAIVLVVLLVDRMARERRETLPAGGTLERETTAGEGIGAFLAGLVPSRSPRPRGPRDDGTPAGALRALYWRYLVRGAAAGVAWRGVGETPAEHERRAAALRPAFVAGAPLVRAFELLRYAEHDPDPRTLEEARAALAAIEDAR